MVFDHHHSAVTEKLTELQHRFIQEIVSTVHVHLDRHFCMEVIVLRGVHEKINAIAHALLGVKGVKHGKLVVTTTGQTEYADDGHRHS
jgi:CopG family nickel-responsive transcriptional regulator